VIQIYHRICESFIQQGKNIKRELTSGNYSFENVVNYIPKPRFLDFLRRNGMGPEEFNPDELDVAFDGISNTLFTLTGLLNYFDRMESQETNSIFDKRNDNFRGILEELIEHLTTGSICLL
jgi:hypothetical protein